MLNINKTDLARHHEARTASDRLALGLARISVRLAGAIFGQRFGDRAVVLETVAAVPSMVAATLLHLKCLRRMLDDHGWVRTFMEEAENQRMHLMSFVALDRPRGVERLLIVATQGAFYNAYFLLYLISARTAHRLAGYFAEQAVAGYSRFLERIEADERGAGPAPAEAVAYWDLPPDADVGDMIRAMREDEAIHRDLHHAFADALARGLPFPEKPGPLM